MTDEQQDMEDDGFLKRDSMIERLVYMILFLFLFAIAEVMIWALAIGQFVWMLFNGSKPNDNIAEFGARLAVWLKRVTMYQSGATDEKPFPWREID